ncbi:MAG: DsrE family protein [Pirellulales bacterium]|nr:DsrE family protein [Pirellulales bacterium]
MRTLVLLVALTVLSSSMLLTGCSCPAGSDSGAKNAAAAGQSEPYGVVLNITRGKDDLHAVSMGLALAIHSLEHGHKTVVFLNVHAPELAVKDLGDDVKYADFPPVREMLRTFMEKGGKLYSCEHCTGVCGVKKENLLEGIAITKHGKLLGELNGNSLVFSY